MNENRRKTAAVTGGAKGIGRNIGLRLAHEGYEVCVLDIDTDSGEKTASDIGKITRGLFVHYDVTDFAGAHGIMQQIDQRFGDLDVLVGSAGVYGSMTTEQARESDWDHIMNVNVKGAFFCIQAAIPYLKKAPDGGCIVNISSAHSRIASGKHALYGASKAALEAMSRGIAADMLQFGIRCLTVSPNTILTSMTEQHLNEPGWKELQESTFLNGRIMQPEDVSEVVAFLVSAEAGHINASDIVVDGGMHFFREKPAHSSYKQL